MVKFQTFLRAFYFWYFNAIFWNCVTMYLVITFNFNILATILSKKLILSGTKILGAPRIFYKIYIVLWKSSANVNTALFSKEYQLVFLVLLLHFETPLHSVWLLFWRLILILTMFSCILIDVEYPFILFPIGFIIWDSSKDWSVHSQDGNVYCIAY